MSSSVDVPSLLSAARLRGQDTLGQIRLPDGSDNLLAYIGLVRDAIELGKLLQTEKRDLLAIQSHYELERARIEAGFHQVETALLLDFEAQRAERTSVYEIIKMLVAAQQYEVAGEFHKRYLEKLDKGAMERLTEERKALAAQAGGSIRVR